MSTLTGIRPGAYGDKHWKAPVANAAALPSSGNAPGDARRTLDDHHEHVWSGSAWIDETASGSQGPQGATGPTGPAGADGAKGDKGDKGDQGSAGAAGATGATGPQGPQGPAGSGGGSGSASPLDYPSNLVFFLDATALTRYSDGDTITSFPDSGPGGNNFSATNCVYKTTGMVTPAIKFDGTSIMSCPNITLSSFSIFIVFSADNGGMLYEHSVDCDAHDGSRLITDINSTMVVHRTQGSYRDLTAIDQGGHNRPWGGDSVWHVVMHEFQGTYRRHRLWVDGGYPLTTNFSSSGPLTGSVTDTLFIGARSGVVYPANMLLAGFVCMSPSLPATDEEKILAGLKYRYSL